ncbi:MAG: hypothetical protein HJJLKODD_00340 [Phycisphaerae bacterium]|nr:hypothetical protein [Phycisphaerae bacterium]
MANFGGMWNRLSQSNDLLALVIPTTNFSTLFTRSVQLPNDWMAVAVGAATIDKYPPGSEIPTANYERLLLMRAGIWSVDCVLMGLYTAEGFMCQATIRLDVLPGNDPSDCTTWLNYCETLEDGLTRSRLAEVLISGFFPGLQQWLQTQSYAQLLQTPHSPTLDQILASGCETTLFVLGLMWQRVAHCHFSSAAGQEHTAVQQWHHLRTTQQHEDQHWQKKLEHERQERLQRAQGWWQQNCAAATTADQYPLAFAAAQIPLTQRGAYYEALWTHEHHDIAAGAAAIITATHLYIWDLQQPDQPRRVIPLDMSAGPARSISWSNRVSELMIGTATGIQLIDISTGTVKAYYRTCPGTAPQGGFNALARADNYLFGSHSELGLRAWPIDQPETNIDLLSELTRKAKTIRHVQVVGEQVWLSIDNRVVNFPWREITMREIQSVRSWVVESSGSITALLVHQDIIFAGTSEGTIWMWTLADSAVPRLLLRSQSNPIESIYLLPHPQIRGLLYCDYSTAVHGLILGDVFNCQYIGPGEPLRRFAASELVVLAMNAQRDQIFYWPTVQPQSPPYRLTAQHWHGRTIQDFCLIPTSQSLSPTPPH